MAEASFLAAVEFGTEGQEVQLYFTTEVKQHM
jgi:hypothetical protein